MTTKIPIPITIQQITPIRFDFCVLITETDVPDEENPLISGRDSPSEETSAEGSALLSSIAEDSAIDSGALGSCSEDSSGSGVGSGVGSGSGSQGLSGVGSGVGSTGTGVIVEDGSGSGVGSVSGVPAFRQILPLFRSPRKLGLPTNLYRRSSILHISTGSPQTAQRSFSLMFSSYHSVCFLRRKSFFLL